MVGRGIADQGVEIGTVEESIKRERNAKRAEV